MTIVTNDYSEYIERTVPKNEQLAALDKLVNDAANKEASISQRTDDLEQLKKQFDQITEHDIPDLLAAMGLEEITTSDGLHVKINKQIETSIPKENEVKAFKWLRDNKFGALLKTEVKILFGMDDDEKAQKLVESLDGQYANVSNKTTIHPSTLKAFGRERLGAGESLPSDIFKVYDGKVAKITQRKK
jgi:5'-3' exonuclease